jgi:hypothetical protein
MNSIKRIFRNALFKKYAFSVVALCGLFAMAAPRSALAIPSYARLYNAECTACHTIYPQRNEFGIAFEKNGFVWPGEGKKAAKSTVDLTDQEKKANEMYSLTGLMKVLPVSLSLRQAYNVDNRDTSVVYQSPAAEIFASAPLFGDQFSFWTSFPIQGSSTTLAEMFIIARRPLDLPVNVRFGKFAPDVALKMNNDRLGSGAAGAGNLTLNGFAPTGRNEGVEVSSIVADRLAVNAGYVDRTAASTLTTFHYDVIGTVSAGTGSVIYSNKKTFDTASQDIKEYYAHVMYKIGGTDYHGTEPDIDLSKESMMDFLSLTVSAFGYDGKSLDTITGEAHALTRMGLEAMVEYKRLAMVFGQQQGVNKETGVDVKTYGNIADITYNISPMLAAVLRYQYTSVDGGKKIKDVYPAIVYAPRQTVKFQVYCDANETRNANGTKATKTTTNLLAQVLF